MVAMGEGLYANSVAVRDDDLHISQRALRERSSNTTQASAHLAGRRLRHDMTGRATSSNETQHVHLQLLKCRQRCEAYRKYRQNQDKNAQQRAQDGVWPDDVEEVFWRAISSHPPMGREKQKLSPHSSDAKAYGRNELIAKYMEYKLGQGFQRLQVDSKTLKTKTPRKVVSSHIQVLKGKFKEPAGMATPENQFVLHWLGKGGKDKKPARARTAASHAQRHATQVVNPFEPENFRMWLAQDVNDEEDTVHDYIPNRSLVRHPDARVTVESLRREFPLLYNQWLEKRLRCNVIYAQSSIYWRSERPEARRNHDGVPRKSISALQLSIQNLFQLRTGSLPPGCYSIVKYFYGGSLYKINGPHKVKEFPQQGGRSQIEVLMGSVSKEFWVTTFQELWKKLGAAKREAAQHRDSVDLEDMAKRIDDQNRQTIALITALVEIYPGCTEDQSGQVTLSSSPMMVVHWAFRTTSQASPGKTAWRNIIMPPTDYDDDDDDDDEMEQDAELQSYCNQDGSVVPAPYEAPPLAMQMGQAPSWMPQPASYDVEQATAGTGIGMPWAAGSTSGRNLAETDLDMTRPYSGFPMDLKHSFDFPDIPLDPGIMSEMDMAGIDTSMMASMTGASSEDERAAAQGMGMSSSTGLLIPPSVSSQRDDGGSQSHHTSQQNTTPAPFGHLFDRHHHGSQGVYGNNNSQSHQQMSSLRSTQQLAHPEQHSQQSFPSGTEQGSFGSHYAPDGHREQLVTPLSADEGSLMPSRRQSGFGLDEGCFSGRSGRRGPPPALSILPSQHDSVADPQPTPASTVSPHSHGRFPQTYSERTRTPQSAAGQGATTFQYSSRDAHEAQQQQDPRYFWMLQGAPHGYAHPHAMYPRAGQQQQHRERESMSEATTTAAASMSGEGEPAPSYSNNLDSGYHSTPQSLSIPQDLRCIADMQGYCGSGGHGMGVMPGFPRPQQAQFCGGEGPGSPDVDDRWPKAGGDGHKQQRGLGLLFDPSLLEGPHGFPGGGQLTHGQQQQQRTEHNKHEEHVGPGARPLLPSPIDG